MPHKEAAFAPVATRCRGRGGSARSTRSGSRTASCCGGNTDVLRLCSPISTRRRRAGTPTGARCRGPRRRRRGARRRCGAAERGARDIRIVNRTPSGRRALAERFGARMRPCAWTRPAAAARRRRPARQHHRARHGRASRRSPSTSRRCPRTPSSPTSSTCRSRRRCWRGAGARPATVDGLGMLLHQAVPGFERWFGVRPAVTPSCAPSIVADIVERA